MTRVSYCMVCACKARGLSSRTHAKTIHELFYYTSMHVVIDVKHWNITQRCIKLCYSIFCFVFIGKDGTFVIKISRDYYLTLNAQITLFSSAEMFWNSRVRCTINRSHSTTCKKAEFEHLQIFQDIAWPFSACEWQDLSFTY